MEERNVPSPRGIPTMHAGAELQEHGYYQSPQYDPRQSVGLGGGVRGVPPAEGMKCTQPPDNRGEIDLAMNALSSEIDIIDAEVHRLISRMNAVLLAGLNEPPNKVREDVRPAMHSPLGSVIEEQSYRISRIRRLVTETIDSIAL